MSAKSRVRVRSVVVSKASRSNDHINLNSRLKPLFPKSETLQLVQTEFLSSAVDDGVFEQDPSHTRVVDCRLDGSTAAIVVWVLGVFELPRVATLVMQQAWVVVSLVEVFKDTGKDLRLSVP